MEIGVGIHMKRSTESLIDEARALVEAAWHTADRRRFNKLLEWARAILAPLAEEKIGAAMWILTSIPDPKSKDISQEEFDRKHRLAAEEAARNGSASAMFFLGCELDSAPTRKESSNYFEQAASLGHTYSKWCFGLNLLSGQGTDKDEHRGLALIREAAEEKFEGAIQFLSHAYARGTHGFPKNEELAAAWWSRLKDRDVIHF
jgi:TPR repeat protein